MKKSTVFLIAALTIPAATALVGVAAGVDRMKVDPAAAGTRLDAVPSEDESAPLQPMLERNLAIDQRLDVDLSNARLDLSFDPQLTGEARINVASRSPEAANAELTKSALSFTSQKEGSPIHVTLTLPAHLTSLDLGGAAVDCQVKSVAPVVVKELSVRVDGGRCRLDMPQLEAAKLDLRLNGGKLELQLAKLATGSVDVETNAGDLVWNTDELSYDPVGGHTLDVRNNAGKTEVHIKKTVAHALDARLQAGELDVKLPGESFELKGLSEQRRIEGPNGAPRFDFEVKAGKGELVIDELEAQSK